MQSRTMFDNMVRKRSGAFLDDWKKRLHQEDTLQAIAKLIKDHKEGQLKEICKPDLGTFNVTIRIKFQDGSSAICRIPYPGVSMFPEEKIRNEVSIVRYISNHTTIPVPAVLHYGTTDECPGRLGPFVITEYVDHDDVLTDALNFQRLPEQGQPESISRMSDQGLGYVDSQITDMLLQLYWLTFENIGSSSQVVDDLNTVAERASTFHIDELVCPANFLPSQPPSTTIENSWSRYTGQAKPRVINLEIQRNDAVGSSTDCKHNYTGHHLFRQISFPNCRGKPEFDKGHFHLWCHDLRPGNILVDSDFNIVSVIDWDFTYAAPAEFVYNSPRWLLLESPEYWF